MCWPLKRGGSATTSTLQEQGKRVKRFGFGLTAACCFGLAATMGMSACGAEEPAPAAKDEKAAAAPAAETKPADAAPPESTPAPAAETPAGGLKPKVEKMLMGGMWRLPDGTPTFNVVGEGEGENRIIKKVDWYTYSGWRRYHAECHVCHGPNAKGSTYAPALADSLKTMDYEKFLQVVASGQQRDVAGTKFIMPALGDNKNVMCYIDDLYIYLKARASDELPPGRLSADQRDEKPQEAKDYENSCVGS
jgi:methanol metabolism-related c-type cytochrome